MKASRIKKGIINRMTKIWTKVSHFNQSIKSIAEQDKYVIAYWSCGPNTSTNWGDAINPLIINHYSQKKALHIANVVNPLNLPVYTVIGSVLDNIRHKNLVIWGSGFKRPSSRLKVPPKEIRLVRGPLSRKIIINSGYKCPESYGDPGLLFPQLYNPKINRQYKIGIIPHYVDFNSTIIQKLRTNKDVNVIDVMSGVYNVVDEALKCEFIASSSLHGLILADAYGIPNTWIKLSDKINGGNFKYYDYYLSLNHDKKEPVEGDNCSSIKHLIQKASVHEFNAETIVECCPFKT